jgi:hypothetical protein
MKLERTISYVHRCKLTATVSTEISWELGFI